MPSTVVTFFPIPASVSVGTANFTVPADSFAKVDGHVNLSVFISRSWDKNASTGGSGANDKISHTHYGNSNDGTIELDEGDTVATSDTDLGNLFFGNSTSSQDIELTPDTRIQINGTDWLFVQTRIDMGHTISTGDTHVNRHGQARYAISVYDK